MTDQETIADLAEQYVAAYNSNDLDALEALLHDDVHFQHHNREVDYSTKTTAMEMFRTAATAFPGKAFSKRVSLRISGDTAILQHTWTCTPTVDAPNMGATAGVPLSAELATFLTFQDGLLREYHDFG
ncbi:nuclear transport factor 2 family protein [Saccharomonospora sp. NPDC046836]|uniref:nuclear transport factor 2 family protein n=1 Tax=Saccharomonospora sp. NPDC046836 TaxID=3156921 RepID=UPI00341167B6